MARAPSFVADQKEAQPAGVTKYQNMYIDMRIIMDMAPQFLQPHLSRKTNRVKISARGGHLLQCTQLIFCTLGGRQTKPNQTKPKHGKAKTLFSFVFAKRKYIVGESWSRFRRNVLLLLPPEYIASSGLFHSH